MQVQVKDDFGQTLRDSFPELIKPDAADIQPMRSRTVCTAKRNCSAKHAGSFVGRACIVCQELTFQIQAVAAWDAPCCSHHDLRSDYRVRVVVGFGEPPRFTVERKIVLAKP